MATLKLQIFYYLQLNSSMNYKLFLMVIMNMNSLIVAQQLFGKAKIIINS